MAGGYGTRFARPIGGDQDAMGGAARNLDIAALVGEGDMVTVFDDFNSVTKGTDSGGGAAIFEDSGWVLTDVGAPASDEIAMNDISNVDLWRPSCLSLDCGTSADTGFNMQLDLINGSIGTLVGTHNFAHIWIPETDAGAAALDQTVFVFAARLGFITNDTTAGDWDGKGFIGWAEAGDTSIITASTGVITQAETGPLVGFHFQEDGSLRGISQRTVNTTYAAGTNYVELLPAGGLDSTLAHGVVAIGDPVWVDVALRMTITDESDNSANGKTEFFYRRVPPTTIAAGSVDQQPAAKTQGPWSKYPTILTNQTPSNDVALVPTIEVANGPTQLSDLCVDWWVFGVSRFSRS